MSTGKATAPSEAEMLSTMEVRACMFPCSGDSAALRRSEENERVAKSHSQYRRQNTNLFARSGEISHSAALTLTAVARRTLLRSAAPLGAAAAGAPRTGLAGRRHLLAQRHTCRSCCQSLTVQNCTQKSNAKDLCFRNLPF